MSRPTPHDIDKRLSIIDGKLDVLLKHEADIQAFLDSIRAERLALQDEYNDLESKRVPFNWLPPELLTEIFLLCIEDSFLDPAEPFDHIPIVLSHVSRRWRSVALATPALWRRLHLRQRDAKLDAFKRPVVRASITRLKGTPVQLVYRDSESDTQRGCALSSLPLDDSSNRPHLFDQLPPLTSLLAAGRQDLLADVLTFLRAQFRVFSCLESLELAATSSDAPASLFHYYKLQLDLTKSFRNPFDSQSFPCLQKLTLRDLSPAYLPIAYYPALRELTIEAGTTDDIQPFMAGLRVQYLARLLACAPNVERLALLGGGPLFHARVEDCLEAAHWTRKSTWSFGMQSTMPPVPLKHLRELCWTEAHPEGVYYLLTHFPADGLEVLDLSLMDIDRQSVRRAGTNSVAVPLTTLLPNAGLLPPLLVLPSLKILRVECTSCDVLRLPFLKLAFPALETLSLANVDPALDVFSRHAPLPHLPRPESIFRDPRMPRLTHLLVSAFSLLEEHAATMLGYMPALERLDCDMVDGGALVLTTLATPRRTARVMRFCPALRAIHLWECNDVHFSHLEQLVKIRNGFPEPHSARAYKQPAASVGERKIKPLKRRAREGQLPQGLAGVEEMQPCVPITEVRISKCKHISEEQARSLEAWGVDVVWG